jgi:hypothetical protein
MERVLDSLLASLPEGVLRARCWFWRSQTIRMVAYRAPFDRCAHLIVVIILFRSAAETCISSIYTAVPSMVLPADERKLALARHLCRSARRRCDCNVT